MKESPGEFQKAAEIRRKSLFPQLFDEKFEILYRCYEDVGGKI